jgi:type III pantothenate kinase
MLLTADIGNTSITLGVFDGEALVEKFRLASDKDLSQDEYEVLLKTLCKPFNVDGCIIASVVDELSKKFQSAVENVFNIKALMLTSECKTGVKVALQNPKEAGADRIANACGAFMLYQKPCIVVDFGTATSFDIVNKRGEFIGGVIAPGLNLQMKVLNKFTSKLPKIDVAISNKAIGNNTSEAILSGVIRGSACMIDGLVEQCEAELGMKATLIATGGYSGLISSYLKRPFDFINPTLTLEGLRFLYQLNSPTV